MASPAKDYRKIGKKIQRYIKDGLRPLQAAQLAGISDQTFYNWREKHLDFLEMINMAENDLERILAKSVRTLSNQTKNVNGFVALLERRYPDRWSTKTTTELTGANGLPISFKIDASGGFINPNNVVTKTVVVKRIEPS